jgi:hypothetical protein
LSRPIIIGPGTRVVQNREPLAVEVDRSIVMMSLDQGKYYGLEGVGGRIWKLIEEPATIAEVCRVLESEFEVDAETCRREVVEFLTQLASEQLIHVVDEAVDPVRAPASR